MTRKEEILKLKGAKKEPQVRKRIPEDAVCEVCGCNKKEFKLRRFNDYTLCEKHYAQLEKYGKITDVTSREHKETPKYCCICGDRKHATFEDKDYCQKHFLQMKRYSKILERTIYDKNEYIIHNDYAEIKLYDKNGNFTLSTKIDLDKVEEIKKYKVYAKNHNGKIYATINMPDGRKIKLNRYLMGIKNLDDWNGKIVVDHINGDSLDNRSCNLRICEHKQNMQNIRKKGKFVGIKMNNEKTKWTASIMHNYESIWLGTFNTREEAMLARLKKEKEICGEFGPNKDLYYIINLSSPIDELKEVYFEEA